MDITYSDFSDDPAEARFDKNEEFRHTKLACCLRAITLEPGGRCILYVPDDHCTDMSGAIRLAKSVTKHMPQFKLSIVAVFSGAELDVVYSLVDGEWTVTEKG